MNGLTQFPASLVNFGDGMQVRAGAGGGGAVPVLEGVSLWAKADQLLYKDAAKTQPATADGDLIYTIGDTSPNANDAVRATNDTFRATLKLNILGGKSVVRFAPNQAYAFTKTVLNTGGNFTLFVVGAIDSLAATRGIFGENDGTRRFVLYATTTNYECRYYSGVAYKNGGQVVAADTNPHIFRVRYDGTTCDLYVDGTLGSGNGSLVGDSTANRSIGRVFVSSVPYMSGDLAELIAVNSALSDEDCQVVEAYLTQRFFLSSYTYYVSP